MSAWRLALWKSLTWKAIGVLSLMAVCALYGLPLVTIGQVTVAYHVITSYCTWGTSGSGRNTTLGVDEIEPRRDLWYHTLPACDAHSNPEC